MNSGIKDVAKLSGTSIATVSRVINNSTNVNPATQKKVRDAIKLLNYEPNHIAQSLRGNVFKSICVVGSRSSNTEYTTKILYSISNQLATFNYNLILSSSKDAQDELEQCISMVKRKIVQGVILIGSKVQDNLIEELHKLQIPFVVIGEIANPEYQNSIYHIDTDNYGDCLEAVNYLIQCGHTRIACLHSDLIYTVNRSRVNGYIEAHKSHNYSIDFSLVIDAGYSISDAYKAAYALLTQDNPPTAIFATDDLKALGCYKAAYQLGLRIPEDISILGHNNYDICGATFPRLTTVDVPIQALGEQSCNILTAIINGEVPMKQTILPTNLLIRDSIYRISTTHNTTPLPKDV